MNSNIYDQAKGRWRSILSSLGVDEKFLKNKHGPCPMCKGKDRYRFDDKDGDGTYFCTKCGAGVGINLVMGLNGIGFTEAVKLVRSVLPQTHKSKTIKTKTGDEKMELIRSTWNESMPPKIGDDLHKYLLSRGLDVPAERDVLRLHPGLDYRGDSGDVEGNYPCMVAAIRSNGGKPIGIHRTWLKDGKKAPVGKPKKSLGKLVASGAIMLYNADDTLGVAEGIETAIAASMMFKIPVWSLISALQMEKFEWPQRIKSMVIFGDNDVSYTGQKAAYSLAYRAKGKGLRVDVEIPPDSGTDWADYVGKK